MKWNYTFIFLLCGTLFLNCCTLTGPEGLFGKKSPHEEYGKRLTAAGLTETTLGKLWFTAAEESLSKPLNVTIPYKEHGYFPAEKARATAIRFKAQQGEKLTIELSKKPLENFTIYIDLWEAATNKNKKLLAYADTGDNGFSYEIDNSGEYIIRLQPELLSGGEYTLSITPSPSLAFPVQKGNIGSYWGADRDDGIRKHEGIDIFASRGTPALAAKDGTIGRVTTNKLGGNVIFMRPDNKSYTLYYAHLDTQLVSAGQKVKAGSAIGLVGNTGNAITTSPHLHFGIYTLNGAINPLAFVKPSTKAVPAIKSNLSNVGKTMRTQNNFTNLRNGIEANAEVISKLNANTIIEVYAAAGNSYQVTLPNGQYGFITSTSVTPVSKYIRQLKLSSEKALYDKPVRTAASKSQLSSGTTVNILGSYEDFYFVEIEGNNGWISNSVQ